MSVLDTVASHRHALGMRFHRTDDGTTILLGFTGENVPPALDLAV
jgi:hypothetical protein